MDEVEAEVEPAPPTAGARATQGGESQPVPAAPANPAAAALYEATVIAKLRFVSDNLQGAGRTPWPHTGPCALPRRWRNAPWVGRTRRPTLRSDEAIIGVRNGILDPRGPQPHGRGDAGPRRTSCRCCPAWSRRPRRSGAGCTDRVAQPTRPVARTGTPAAAPSGPLPGGRPPAPAPRSHARHEGATQAGRRLLEFLYRLAHLAGGHAASRAPWLRLTVGARSASIRPTATRTDPVSSRTCSSLPSRP